MQQIEPQSLIKASPLFQRMQPQEIEMILARLQPFHFSRGTCILERGIWHGRLYLIASGQVSVSLQDRAVGGSQKESPSQASYIVTRLGPGECFGEMSLLTGEPPTATVRVEQESMFWSLTHTDFLALVGTCPTLLQNINGILSRRLARTNQHLLSNHAAEILFLRIVDTPAAPVEHALAFYVAEALAMRTHKRVLLLELCGSEDALYTRFATHADQVRPTLLACGEEGSLLQAHRAPTSLTSNHYFPALSSLADTHEQVHMVGSGWLSALADLSMCYDYLLLATSQSTSTQGPTDLIDFLRERQETAGPYTIKKVITLVSAQALQQYTAASFSCPEDVFVTHTAQVPSIGLQDRYQQESGHRITRLLPADEPLLQQSWQQCVPLRQLAPQALLTQAIDFVARSIANLTIGIAFGGGGARGFAHLGVLEGLLAHDIPLDYLAACSIGVIAPGMHLLGKSLAESEKLFLSIQQDLTHWTFPRTSIFSNRGLKRRLRDICGEVQFQDLPTPFAIVAVDLSTRAGVVLDRGPLWQAALASVALPGIYPPVLIGKHILVDAGMHDPVPVRLLRRMGADILIASELGGKEPPSLENAASWPQEVGSTPHVPSPHLIDILLRSYELAMATIGMHSIREADLVIRPGLHRIPLQQFAAGHQFIAKGREEVEAVLPTLRRRLPWL